MFCPKHRANFFFDITIKLWVTADCVIISVFCGLSREVSAQTLLGLPDNSDAAFNVKVCDDV